MLPILLTDTTNPCLLVGGGKVGARRAEKILAAGIKLEVETPTLTREFKEFRTKIKHLRRKYKSRNLSQYTLVFACTNNPKTNKLIYTDARKSSVPVSLADNPELSDFQLPAIIRHDPLIIGINTGTPSFSKMLAHEIAENLPDNIAEYSQKLQRIRNELKQKDISPNKKIKFIEKLIEPVNYRKVLKYNCTELLYKLKI